MLFQVPLPTAEQLPVISKNIRDLSHDLMIDYIGRLQMITGDKIGQHKPRVIFISLESQV